MGKGRKTRGLCQGRYLGEGRRLIFLGISGSRARFTLEEYADSLRNVSVVAVPLRWEPRNRRQRTNARRWATRRILAALGAA